MGSAGSLRLRGAILQIVVNVVHHGLPVEEAIEAPRIHFDDGQVHCEGGADPAELDRLEARGYELVRWRGGISTSAARQRSSAVPTARSRPPATRGAAGMASSCPA